VNKWDLSGETSTDGYVKFLDSRLARMRFAPVIFISAKDGERVWDVARVAGELWREASRTCSTADVNRALREALERRSPPVSRHGPGKAYYATQVGTAPPRFAVFVNSPGRFDQTYRRYLAGAMADSLGFEEVPVKLMLRPRERSPNKKRSKAD